MIDQIDIVGFKCFSDYTLKLAGLTVLTGLNNSGKSTALQALRMCANPTNNSGAYLPGLGDYVEIKSDLTSPGLPISLKTSSGKTFSELRIEQSGFVRDSNALLPLVQFVAADRYGSKVELPIKHNDGSVLSVGEKGEYVAHFASALENCLVSNRLRHPSSTSHTLKHQLTAWMSEIAPGIKLNFDIQKQYDSSRLEVNGRRATNSGFGISYALPIILLVLAMTGEIGKENSEPEAVRWFATLAERSGGLLLIENPEAHLHPKGQTALGKLLVLAASAGLQIVIETHSDHLIDGIRLGVRQLKAADPQVAEIRFFTKTTDDQPVVTDIKILASGKLTEWPKGFFDQMSRNLVALSSKSAE